MSSRAALALREFIRGEKGKRKFFVMESVDERLALQLEEVWDSASAELPKLSVLRASDLDLPSVAKLRHESATGAFIVTVRGVDVAERQSINNFVSISLDRLLVTPHDLMLLASNPVPVRVDGPMAAVRHAIVQLPKGAKPRALDVAYFFDQSVGEISPQLKLNLLGAFVDEVSDDEVTSQRVQENFELASEVLAGQFGAEKKIPDIRQRANQVVLKRPPEQRFDVDAFLRLVELQSPQVLSWLNFEEAVEIFRKKTASLGETVKAERDIYVAENPDDRDELAPVADYADEVDKTKGSAVEAAEAILIIDEAHDFLTPPTRKRLQNLLKDRKIASAPDTPPVLSLAKAISMLDAPPTAVVLEKPALDDEGSEGFDQVLAVGLFGLLAADALSFLDEEGVSIDAYLSDVPWSDWDLEDIRRLFIESFETVERRVEIRVESASSSRLVVWEPSTEFLAFGRVLVEFAASESLQLHSDTVMHRLSQILRNDAYRHGEIGIPALQQLGRQLSEACQAILRDGLRPTYLSKWCSEWTTLILADEQLQSGQFGQSALLSGSLHNPGGLRAGGLWLSPLCPIKADWLIDFLGTGRDLLRDAIALTKEPVLVDQFAFSTSEQALTDVTSAGLPAFLRVPDDDRPLLPNVETRWWSLFGGASGSQGDSPFAVGALETVIRRLMRLQPEVTAHFKCVATDGHSGALLVEAALGLLGSKVDGQLVTAIDLTVRADAQERHPDLDHALASADSELRTGDSNGRLNVRFIDPSTSLVSSAEGYEYHFGLIADQPIDDQDQIAGNVEIECPQLDPDRLFTPRVWQRPDKEHRLLLVSPGVSKVGATWLRLCHSFEDRWPGSTDLIAVPEVRLGAFGIGQELRSLHESALWVGVLGKYVTRDGLDAALPGEIAILHQEKRFGTESPMGLVVSQAAGGPVDRAIGRSLRLAGIVKDDQVSRTIGTGLREIATQGYGILALEAATSGTGINELVGHVVGFSLLGKKSTPWPLPAGCRIIMVSLDDNPQWFARSKRADLVALALDPQEKGVHGAVIEVKARRSGGAQAGKEALEQLKKTLLTTAYVLQPDSRKIASRVWLNRLAEAAYAVARESRIRLQASDLQAIENFRRGSGTLEWGGLGLVFGPGLKSEAKAYRQDLLLDSVPILIEDVPLTEQVLQEAIGTDLRELFTEQVGGKRIEGGRRQRRPEKMTPAPPLDEEVGPQVSSSDPEAQAEPTSKPASGQGGSTSTQSKAQSSGDPSSEGSGATPASLFDAPVLGWESNSGEPLLWKGAGGPGGLSNGHLQIWGSSGVGKTQFIKSLLSQLAGGSGTNFAIADFKNDYSPEAGEDFITATGAHFVDMWGKPGAPFNPLAIEEGDDIDAKIIEFRDAVEQACAGYVGIGVRQKQAIKSSLEETYAMVAKEKRSPTMLDLHGQLHEQIRHILEDLTKYRIFDSGPNFSAALEARYVFGLNRIPGNGQTTNLAAAFLLSDLASAVQNLPPVANTIRYVAVVDEAHRVSKFKALSQMIREGRSKGLAVFLATQAPGDLPEVVDANAQTRICFRLSDNLIAGQAAKKLDSKDASLPGIIQNLSAGEALVSLGGQKPRVVEMKQFYRDQGLMHG